MVFQYRLLTLILLTGCVKPTTNNDSLANKVTEDTVQTESLITVENDTLSYIGYLNKFDDNDFFYTDIYFVENFNYDLYDDVAKMGDEVIFKDEEIRRTKITIEEARKYFNLSGLGIIDIYNDRSQKLATGQLSHIEYIEDMIESRFVAVFQVNNPEISEPLFCVGNPTESLTEIDFLPYQDEKLKAELISFLKLNADAIWSSSHYKLDNQIISTVSADTTAYIIETKENSHEILYKSKFNEAIHGLTAISKEVNGRQIILTDCGMPETDMTWSSVLIFNGTEYEVSKDHRIGGR